MRLKIYKEEKEEEQACLLRLVSHDISSITLVACRSNGNTIGGGNLLTITPKGVFFCCGVSKDIGFPLTDWGKTGGHELELIKAT